MLWEAAVGGDSRRLDETDEIARTLFMRPGQGERGLCSFCTAQHSTAQTQHSTMQAIPRTEQPKGSTHARIGALKDGLKTRPVDLTRGSSRHGERHGQSGSAVLSAWHTSMAGCRCVRRGEGAR